MKKFYCLVDAHEGDILCASKSKRFLEELQMDIFMEWFRNDMQEAVDEHWIDMEHIMPEDRKYAQDLWDSIMQYSKSVFKIQKVEIL